MVWLVAPDATDEVREDVSEAAIEGLLANLSFVVLLMQKFLN